MSSTCRGCRSQSSWHGHGDRRLRQGLQPVKRHECDVRMATRSCESCAALPPFVCRIVALRRRDGCVLQARGAQLSRAAAGRRSCGERAGQQPRAAGPDAAGDRVDLAAGQS